MSVIFIDDLPGLADGGGQLTLRTQGYSAFIRSSRFIGRIDLRSGKVEWLVERESAQTPPSVYRLPRRIENGGSDLWVSETNQTVAEITATECGGLSIVVRESATGNPIWNHFFPIPEAADWAEASPAWPGAQTEEIYAFLADDPNSLAVCLLRQSRISGAVNPALGINVLNLPPYRCQTDAARFDPGTGAILWRKSFRDVPVGILERKSFTGLWSNEKQVGTIDFDKGTDTILRESPDSLGWPVQNGPVVSVPWRSKDEVGVDWINGRGERIRRGAWHLPRVLSTKLHAAGSRLALQTNDQMLWWLGEENLPQWNVRAKPYIYRVHCSSGTDVFVGTDGNGGRLLGFDAVSGRESLNLKPTLGGVGYLAKVPGHEVLVSSFLISRSYSTPARLLVLSMHDKSHDLSHECRNLVGTWEHGAICCAGRNGERLAIVDIRTSER